jgi:hypothetical protein
MTNGNNDELRTMYKVNRAQCLPENHMHQFSEISVLKTHGVYHFRITFLVLSITTQLCVSVDGITFE